MDIPNTGNNFGDIAAGVLMLAFTGTEMLGGEMAIVEIISKFGVVAVLWFWLRDLKKQLKDQLLTFDKETNEIRKHYDKILEDKNKEFVDYKNRMDFQLSEKNTFIKDLQKNILDKENNN
jgi:hypothetical protein